MYIWFMNEVFKETLKVFNIKDCGCSEDEFNNFLIDMYLMSEGKYELPKHFSGYAYLDASGEVKYIDKPISVTITLKCPDKHKE